MLIWLLILKDVITMRDEDFPGRNDKLIWFIVVFFGNVFGAFAFFTWRTARLWRATRSNQIDEDAQLRAYQKAYPRKAE